MYVIGTDEWHFIKVKRKNMYDGKEYFLDNRWSCYNIPNKDNKNKSMSIIKSNFTIFDDLKYTKKLYLEIKNNKNMKLDLKITFIIESIIDKQNNKKFDVNRLKIYELVQLEINSEEV